MTTDKKTEERKAINLILRRRFAEILYDDAVREAIDMDCEVDDEWLEFLNGDEERDEDGDLIHDEDVWEAQDRYRNSLEEDVRSSILNSLEQLDFHALREAYMLSDEYDDFGTYEYNAMELSARPAIMAATEIMMSQNNQKHMLLGNNS